MAARPDRDDNRGDWKHRLEVVVQTMREMSEQTDPQAMVRAYGERMRELLPSDDFVALSRRGLDPPKYRITRSSRWTEDINPWKQKHRLPLLAGGLLGELLYGDAPRIVDEVQIADDDPGSEYLNGNASLLALPNYDRGVSLNMTILMRKEPASFRREELPEWVWMANLFGRATQNLVLADELDAAYRAVDHELKVVSDIQRSLLPEKLPEIPTMTLAAHYQTSQRAGGDYYDFFPLPDGQWGILIADVSGHGTPAAVMMAITHSIAHTYPGPPTPPNRMLDYLNQQLHARYTANRATFVTAFYGIYDPATRRLEYACAGHNPPRLKSCGANTVESLDGAHGFPLGIMPDQSYPQCARTLNRGDRIVFYTDGITEVQDSRGDQFGVERMDDVLADCTGDASDVLRRVLSAVEQFTSGAPAEDDRTVLVADLA